jgi:hypothetical protein
LKRDIKESEEKIEVKEEKRSNLHLTYNDETLKELFKASLKEKSLKVIVEGHPDPIKKLEKYFDKNPDRFVFNEMDPNFLFNQRLSNKKNLLYVACQEGNYDVVKFFLINKKLNPYLFSEVIKTLFSQI